MKKKIRDDYIDNIKWVFDDLLKSKEASEDDCTLIPSIPS